MEPRSWDRLAGVVKVFLEHGQNANVDIPVSAYGKGGGACKALHLARCEVSKTLLKHGAHVNALNGTGLTALDYLIYVIVESGKKRLSFEDLYATAIVLLDYGGCITYSTKRTLPEFINILSNMLIFELPENLRNPPQLPMTLTQRVRSIVPSYLGGA
jgi:hypothetical protein